MRTPVAAWFLVDKIVEESGKKGYIIGELECEWRNVLKDLGIELSEILAEELTVNEQPKKKKPRLEVDPPSTPKLLPHVFVVSSPGECNIYCFESQDEERRKNVMDAIHQLRNRESTGLAMVDYLLKRLVGIFEEDSFPEDFQEVNINYNKISPIDEEWSFFDDSESMPMAQPSASTTVISRVWG